MGVCADVQPAWLFKDGTTLFNVLGDYPEIVILATPEPKVTSGSVILPP